MKENRLTTGKIFPALLRLSLPIMGTSFMQMAYSLMDMFWIGSLGAKAVAGVGTGGFFVWLAMSFILLISVGTQAGIAQASGRNDIILVRSYSKTSLQMGMVIGILYSIVLIFFYKTLVSIFNISDLEVLNMAHEYTRIVGFGVWGMFLIKIYTSIWNGYGNSKLPFVAFALGLIVNMVLDPLFINVFNMGVKGAALATIISMFLTLLVFLFNMKLEFIFCSFKEFFIGFDFKIAKDILCVGLPVSIQSFVFTFVAMVVARFVAFYGAMAIAVQRLGVQIESITWRTADGIGVAVNTFVGQNYGANKSERIKDGYFIALFFASLVGIATGLTFIFFGKQIFGLFLNEKGALNIGVDYARILGYSQVFMCIEAVSAGAFNGFKKTKVTSAVSIIFTVLRVPVAYLLSMYFVLGLNGIWWAISLSSMLKGTVIMVLFIVYIKKNKIW